MPIFIVQLLKCFITISLTLVLLHSVCLSVCDPQSYSLTTKYFISKNKDGER